MRHPQHAHPHGLPTSVIQPATSSVNDDWYLNEFSYQQRAKTKKVKKLKSGEAGAKRRSREGKLKLFMLLAATKTQVETSSRKSLFRLRLWASCYVWC